MKVTKLLILILLMTIAGTFIYADSAEGYIEEISVKDYDSEYDIHVRIKWTGSGQKTKSTNSGEWMEVRHGEFGHKGVDRIMTLLLTAYSMHKTCWIEYSGSKITAINLKYTPN